MTVGGVGDGHSEVAGRQSAPPLGRESRSRDDLARQWAERLSGTAYIPMARPDVEQRLLETLDLLADAVDGRRDADEAGRRVGTRLVDMHATGEESLSRSLELLRDNLLDVGSSGRVQQVLGVLAAVATGYAAAVRESTRAQQETLKRALLRSKTRTERQLEVSEQRFREMFLTTPVGVAICDLDGNFVEVNPALEDTVGYSGRELTDRTVYDLFHPDEVTAVADAFAELAAGSREPLRERRNLVRSDETHAWTYVAVSVLRDADGAPHHFVVMFEDLRELSSLQDRLRHQALHDPMTGLANRQYFRTRLESALVKLPRDAVVTMYHLGLDGFDLINDGLGYEVGDEMVGAVASRLSQLVENEDGMVARFGGTEFAVLLRQAPETPDIASFAALINEELSEPIYVADQGIATSASIGVTQCVVAEGRPAQLMWEADVALRHAEAAGKRQWALFDPDRAPRERVDARLTATMPGALELGEFEVLYQPLMSMTGGGLVAVEARLNWQPQGHEPLGHDECLRLAERSGITLSLRDWMLHTAWQQIGLWLDEGYEPRLIAGLSPNQSRDPDLVARLHGVIGGGDASGDGAGPDVSRLRVCMPISALMGEGEEARDNVDTLAAMGVQTALHGFRASPEELWYLRELPVHAVQFSAELVGLVNGRESDDAPEVRAVSTMIPLMRDTGVPIAVAGIDSEAQERWWSSLGCEIGSGEAYRGALSAAEMTRMLAETSAATR